jgi:hypothetical protein
MKNWKSQGRGERNTVKQLENVRGRLKEGAEDH